MVKIAICDDEERFRKMIKRVVAEFLDNRDIQYDIDVYDDGKAFIQIGESISKYDIVFLDIDMKEVNGLATAKVVREYNKRCFLVFETAFQEYSLEGYIYRAVRYIIKTSAFADYIIECMECIMEEMNTESVKTLLGINKDGFDMKPDTIVYLESDKHRIAFYKEDGTAVYEYGKLEEYEKKLTRYGFFRIHQSYLVNFKYITNIECYSVTLENKKVLPIPKVKYKDVKKAYIEYKGGF